MAYTLEDENRSACPQYSPGPVACDEELLRAIFAPEHVVDGKVIETAISGQDLKERGFSVDRRIYAKKSTFMRTINNQMKNKPEDRQEPFVSIFECRNVRQIVDDSDERAFIVIDTALSNNSAHASIYSAKHKSRGMIKKLKTLLLPILQQYIGVEEIF